MAIVLYYLAFLKIEVFVTMAYHLHSLSQRNLDQPSTLPQRPASSSWAGSSFLLTCLRLPTELTPANFSHPPPPAGGQRIWTGNKSCSCQSWLVSCTWGRWPRLVVSVQGKMLAFQQMPELLYSRDTWQEFVVVGAVFALCRIQALPVESDGSPCQSIRLAERKLLWSLLLELFNYFLYCTVICVLWTKQHSLLLILLQNLTFYQHCKVVVSLLSCFFLAKSIVYLWSLFLLHMYITFFWSIAGCNTFDNFTLQAE